MQTSKYYYPPVNFWSVWFSEIMLYFVKKNGVIIKPQYSVLDVGCGLGNHCFCLMDYQLCEIYGFDISKDTINLLNEFGQPVKFTAFDVCEDDISEYKNRFDIIFSGDVYEHVSDPQLMLNNISAMLKSKGCICITFPNEETHGHNQIYDIEILNTQLKTSGFESIDIEVITGVTWIYGFYTEIYLYLQKLSDLLMNIKRGQDRRPESDEFHEFYAYKKIQKIKNKKMLIMMINFIYNITKKIARIRKPFKGHNDYRNIKDKRFILFARKAT